MSRRQMLFGSTAAVAVTAFARSASTQMASPVGDPFRAAFVYLTSPSDLGYAYAHDQGRIALENAVPGVETSSWEGVADNDLDEGARWENTRRRCCCAAGPMIQACSMRDAPSRMG
jgi:simple sugar transport system substrate-binding protein